MSLGHYLALGGLLFLIGIFGALTRRNIVGILMSIELMFNAANINLAAFNHFLHPGGVAGMATALFIITVAAAEAAVGLAVILVVFRRRKSVRSEDLRILKG